MCQKQRNYEASQNAKLQIIFHLGCLNMHQRYTAQGLLVFCLYQNETVAAGIKLVSFGSAAMHHDN